MGLLRASAIWLTAIAIAGVIAAGAVLIPVLTFVPSGLRDDPAREAALNRYFEGHKLFDAGRYAEATACYRSWKDYEDSHGEDSSEVTGLLGHTLDLAGRADEARELIDASLAIERRWYVCVYKAHFLARHESEAAALAWLERVDIAEIRRARAIASFHRERGQHAAAIPMLNKVLELVAGRRFLVDGALGVPATIDTETHNQVAGLLDPLRDLAESHLGVRDLEMADHYARLGIAVGQLLKRDDTYAGTKYVEAGDAGCRVVRARVLVQRGEWDAAAQEIELATAITGRTYTGWERAVQAATEEIERAKPKR